jgi:multicomponent Na+:H+ antiporter subunit A
VRSAIGRIDVGYRIGPEKVYVVSELSMLSFAKRLTGLLQNGRLRLYLLIVVSTLVGLVWLILLYTGSLPTLTIDRDVYAWEALIAALIAGGAVVAVTSRSRLGAVTALGVVGYGIALVYVLFSAPDLAIAQILVETLTVLLFVLVFYHMPRFGADTARSSRLRDGTIASAAGLLVTVFVLIATGTISDPVSVFFLENSQPLAKGQNVVNTIIVDFRSLDTLAEVAVLAIAGFGVYALLKLRSRKSRGEGEA